MHVDPHHLLPVQASHALSPLQSPRACAHAPAHRRRYGSELTHARHDKCTGGKILHGRLQYYFRGYNHETRRFIPQHKPNSLEPFMMQLVEDVGLPEQRVQKLFGGMP